MISILRSGAALTGSLLLLSGIFLGFQTKADPGPGLDPRTDKLTYLLRGCVRCHDPAGHTENAARPVVWLAGGMVPWYRSQPVVMAKAIRRTLAADKIVALTPSGQVRDWKLALELLEKK